MILLIDADSLVYASCCKKRETQDDNYHQTDITEARNKFDEQFMKIVNRLEEMYTVEKIITFNGSRGNFRKYIGRKYKENRSVYVRPPLLFEMHDYVKTQYDSIVGYGVETDDMVARYWHNLTNDLGRNEVMIVSIDKDYKQFPALIYNYHYKHQVIYDISEDQAMYNFYEQMVAGDAADNVNYFKGKGKRFCEKYFAECHTRYQYTRKLYELFKTKYKSKAKEKYSECYNLLKLKTE